MRMMGLMLGRQGACLAAALVLTIGIAGCTGQANNANLVPVTGNIKLDNKPLAGASVTFLVAGGTPGLGGVGITDEAGNFEVADFRAGKGLAPGDYKIVVSKIVMADGSPIPAGTVSIAELNTRELLPRRYADPNATVLNCSIKGGDAPVTLELASR